MKLLLSSLFTGLALSCRLSAAVTVFTFTGVIDAITQNDDAIIGAVNVGDPVHGYFTFDPDGHVGGDAYHAVIAISVSGDLIEVESNLNFIRARDNYGLYDGRVVDRFEHGFDSSGPTPALDPLYVYFLNVRFTDPDATVFDGSEVLPVDLNLIDYEEATWSFGGADLATRRKDFRLSGTITSIAVPEPSAGSLLVATVVLGGWWRRRRANKTRLDNPLPAPSPNDHLYYNP